MPGRVVAIVVTYESRAEIAACLDALAAQAGGAPETWVVDNASKDGTAPFVREHYPAVHVVANAANVGFARANNQVLEAEAADVYLLVNPDAMPSAGALPACRSVLDAEPEVAVVAPRLVDPDGTTQRSAHGFPTLANLLGQALGLDRLFPRTALGSFDLGDFAHDVRRDVDWIQGAFLAVRGDAVRRVGAFDPAFFMYGEETDWCFRFARAGYRTVFLPGPPVTHIGGASSRTLPGPMFVELLKSRLRLFDRHRGALAAGAARGLVALLVVLRLAAWQGLALLPAGPPAPREQRRLRARMFRAAFAWVLSGMPLTPPRLPA